jgi:pilus assembly protein Flp/PilA
MLDKIRVFASPTRRNEEGASAVEYGLLVALIAAVVVIAVFALGSLVKNTFHNTCQSISDNSAQGTGGTASTCDQ